MKIAICLDGHDGAGKTTIAHHLVKRYQQVFQTHRVPLIKFPTNNLYHRLNDPSEQLTHDDFLKDMEEQKFRNLDPSVTIFDRSFLTTAVYQGCIIEKGCFDWDEAIWQECFERGSKLFGDYFDVTYTVQVECDPEIATDRLIKNLEKADGVATDPIEKRYVRDCSQMVQHRAAANLELELLGLSRAFEHVQREFRRYIDDSPLYKTIGSDEDQLIVCTNDRGYMPKDANEHARDLFNEINERAGWL